MKVVQKLEEEGNTSTKAWFLYFRDEIIIRLISAKAVYILFSGKLVNEQKVSTTKLPVYGVNRKAFNHIFMQDVLIKIIYNMKITHLFKSSWINSFLLKTWREWAK